MKIDLDAMARAAEPKARFGLWWDRIYDAPSPEHTLALVERIRELEAMLVGCGYTFPPPLAAEVAALLEKGVVIE